MGITIQNIAEQAKVSTATVSRALNKGQSGIRPEVRDRIVALAKSMGYKKRHSVSSDETNNYIGVIYKRSAESILSKHILDDRLYHSIELALYGNNQQMMMHNLSLNDSIPSFLKSNLVSAVMLVELDIPADDKLIAFIKKNNIAAVAVNPAQEFDAFDEVRCDYLSCFATLTHRLFNRGCRKIAFVSNDFKHFVTKNSFLGYVKALIDHGQTAQDAIWLTEKPTADIGASIASQLQAAGDIDGIVCMEYDIAQSTIAHLLQAGIKVPEQIKVCAFDPDVVSKKTYSITAGCCDFNFVAECAIEKLIESKANMSDVPISMLSKCDIIEGNMD